MEKQQFVPNKMGVQPVGALVLKMSLPMMVSMLVQALYNIVDSMFVARISENALTAVSLAFPYQLLVISVAVGTGVGVNSLAARLLGEKKQAEANYAAAHGQLLALVTGLIFGLLFALFTPQLIGVFKPEEEIYQYACTYMYWVGVPSLFVISQCMFERILQATGDTLHSMMAQLSGAIFNLIFDPILIFGLLGFPRLGVAGAAIATVGGQILGMSLAVFFLHKKNDLIDVSMKGFKPDATVIKEIYRVGMPSIVMQAIGSVTNFGMNKILIAFTPTAVSVLGVYFKLQSFVFMPVFGLSSGTMPIMGYNYGARDKARVMSALKHACLYALIIMCLGTALFQIFAEELLMLFDASDYMLEIGVPALRIISVCFPSAALGIVFSTLFQAIGNGKLSLFVSACRQLVVILPVAYLLANTYGLHATWLAYPIAEGIALAISALLLVQTIRNNIATLEDGPVQ
ncbi:MAG: MATE family efflux transporter [Clostridia bacterium]|nr:MATE family efflux transporter [Candidatus Pelethousia sp.]NCB30203.1 MATE family efflux transporter [Clostridia bacterium]